MSRLQQYLIFGGIILIIQTDFFRKFLNSSWILPVVIGIIFVFLGIALGMTLYIKRRDKKQKGKGNGSSPTL